MGSSEVDQDRAHGSIVIGVNPFYREDKDHADNKEQQATFK